MSLKEYPLEHTRMEEEEETEDKVDTPDEENEDKKTTEDNKDKSTTEDTSNLKCKKSSSTTRRYKLLRFDLDTQ